MFYDCFWKNKMKIKKQTKLKSMQNKIKKPHKQHRHSLCTCWSFMDISRIVSENVGVCFIFELQKMKRQKKQTQKNPNKITLWSWNLLININKVKENTLLTNNALQNTFLVLKLHSKPVYG